MTYQEIVNRIQTIVNAHYQLADFGYGDLSDLKTRFENSSGDTAVQADYPYLFLNPGVHNRTLTTMTYNFNMIVMDMARGEVNDQPYNNILAIQSQCQQMIDDVLATLYYGFKDQPEIMRANMSYTPFNERFQDDVAGMTASLSIEVPTGLNYCIAPVDPTGLEPIPPNPPIVQYLRVRLLGCTNFDLGLFLDPEFTQPANAVCDYIVSGTAYGDMGTVYTGTETIMANDHIHTFNLNPVLEQGECVSGFTVGTITPQCEGVTIIYGGV